VTGVGNARHARYILSCQPCVTGRQYPDNIIHSHEPFCQIAFCQSDLERTTNVCGGGVGGGWSVRNGAARIKRNMQAVVNQWTESQSCERLWLITGQNIPCSVHTRCHGLCPRSVTTRVSEIRILIICQGSQSSCVLCPHTCLQFVSRLLSQAFAKDAASSPDQGGDTHGCCFFP
jgi:hypothetical protein